MAVLTREILLKNRERDQITDLTAAIREVLRDLPVQDGIVTVFIPGSTAGITTIEFESGVVRDLRQAFERLIPTDLVYDHDRRWGDGNGYSHVRAALCKPSLTIPFVERRLTLGTWQQVVLLDFDNRPRERRVILQFLGE